MAVIMPAPRITVLMTTYNGAATIAASVDSVLAQNFADFELVVVDDGSTDATPDILAGYRDPRIRPIKLARNCGIVAARNRGFMVARGSYLAALDHDDLSHPDRLARQSAYLDENPDVVLIGTEVRIAADGDLTVPDHPTVGDKLALHWLLLCDNPLTWSSVMLRTDAVRQLGAFMRPEYEYADDFDLYHRLLAVGGVARLADVLTTYHYHSANASHANTARLNRNAARVLEAAYIGWLGDEAAPAAELVVSHLSERQPVRDAATLQRLGSYLERLLVAFCDAQKLAQTERECIAALAGATWWHSVRSAVRSGSPSLIWVYRSRASLSSSFRPGVGDRIISLAVGGARAVRLIG
jgi:GT2 family glycosyltransferase